MLLHGGVISTMIYFVSRVVIFKYCNANIKITIMQPCLLFFYGFLKYVFLKCTSFSNIKAIFLMSKKLIKMIYFKRTFDSISDEFQYNKTARIRAKP